MATTDSPARPGGIDKESLRRKYAEERDKRLRPDGNDQYLRLAGRVRALPRRPLHAADRAGAEDRPPDGRVRRRRASPA